MASAIRRIAVLTSGGDAPGMNAAVRAVVRCAVAQGMTVVGVRNGFAGLVAGEFTPLTVRSVGGIMQQGGTVLGSARCPEFATEPVQRAALEQLAAQGIEGLVVIGGNGSQQGSAALARHGFLVVGVASTIDNDLAGTDITIGATTALDVALEAIDRLRATASAMHRAFLVEVMGRKCGYLALMAALAGGAEAVVLPEFPVEPEDVARALQEAQMRGKSHAIVVVAEGAPYNATAIAEHFRVHRDRLGFEVRVTILGHVQRGAAPNAFDRILASQLGAAAADTLARGEHGVLIGLRQGRVSATPLHEIAGVQKPLDPALYRLVQVLAM